MGKYIGTMHIVGEMNSFNSDTNECIFGFIGEPTTDHIWPKSRNGSNVVDNKQTLSREANLLKANDIKGTINEVRYTTHMHTEDEYGKVVGQMYVTFNGGIDWYKVIGIHPC
ncbi:MAG: hypothetical protein KAG14_05155 [Mycoplasmataceae bacterium]|nr:hypothetical protein [Mycoplasmataceae bacterium]